MIRTESLDCSGVKAPSISSSHGRYQYGRVAPASIQLVLNVCVLYIMNTWKVHS